MELSIYKPLDNPKESYSPREIPKHLLDNGIVVRSPNWLGDAAMALPGMFMLKSMLPKGAKFSVVTPAPLKIIFESIDWIDNVITIGSGHSKLSAEDVDNIRKTKSKVGFLFVNSLKSAYYFKKAGINKVYGSSNGIRNIFLKKPFKVSWNIKNDYDNCHQTFKYLAMISSMGCSDWDGTIPPIKFEPSDNIKNMVSQYDKLLLIQPGAAYGDAKKWGKKHFANIIKWWCETNGNKVILVGTPNEAKECEEVVKLSGVSKELAINSAGKTTMQELLEIISLSDVCLCNDSGVMHIASILSKNGVAIFGSTDPFSTGPICGKWYVLFDKQDCAPCFSRTCNKEEGKYSCLDAVKEDMVKKAILAHTNNV